MEAAAAIDTLMQQCCFVPARYKKCFLVYMLERHEGTSMVFTCTRRSANELALTLQNLGLRAITLSRDHVTEEERHDVLQRFTVGDYNILVCTNEVNEGLHIPYVDMVINYDTPPNTESYIRRVAHTGPSGVAISLVTQYDVEWYMNIEKRIGKKLPAYPAEQEEVLLLHERVELATQ